MRSEKIAVRSSFLSGSVKGIGFYSPRRHQDSKPQSFLGGFAPLCLCGLSIPISHRKMIATPRTAKAASMAMITVNAEIVSMARVPSSRRKTDKVARQGK